MLPESLVEPLRQQLAQRREIYDADRAAGRSTEVHLPDALAVKYPRAGSDWTWQYVFAAAGYSRDPRSGVVRRHHVDELAVQRQVKRAAAQAGIAKPVSPHVLTIRLLRTCWRLATIFAPCRNCSATPT